jgi:hypothetical protein
VAEDLARATSGRNQAQKRGGKFLDREDDIDILTRNILRCD